MTEPTKITKITPEQFALVMKVIRETAQRGNFVAQAIVKAVDAEPNPEKRRNMVMVAYSQAYELISVTSMALQAKVSPEQFATRLSSLKRKP